jgi:hypothetical protein
MEMKNNEWNVPSDYFEKNKKALMPVRKFPTGKWLLALAAACFVGIGLFMWKSEDQSQEIARVENQNEKQNENEGKIGEDIGAKNLSTKEDIGAKNLSTKEDIGSKNLSTKEEIAEELKEIPREELVAYLLEEDSELIENLN